MINRRLIECLADGRFHSGSEVGEVLQVSRAAVWKKVKKLIDFGLVIHAVPGKGYQVPGGLDLFREDDVSAKLTKELIGDMRQLLVIDAVASSVKKAFDLLDQEGVSQLGNFCGVLTESRTLSRVKYGRAKHTYFAGDIDLAIATYVPADWVGNVKTLLSVASTLRVLASLRGYLECQVRWPVELMWNGLHLGGVEVDFEPEDSGDKGHYSPLTKVAVGVKVCVRSSRFLAEPRPAGQTSLEDVLGVKRLNRNELAADILNGLYEVMTMSSEDLKTSVQGWRMYDLLSDRFVKMNYGGEPLKGCARGIDSEGCLRLETDQGIAVLDLQKEIDKLVTLP